MKWGWSKGKNQAKENSLQDSENLANLLVALSGKWDTPALIAYLADERDRLLLCKALVSPVSGSDRQLAQRADRILRFRGLDPDQLKKRLEPAAVALGLGSACDIQIDYYGVLGVKPSATPSELRVAYRKMAFEIHPDTAGETPENSADFVTLKAAYDTLMEPNSRAAFDQCHVQLDSWYEEDPEKTLGEREKRQPRRKLRKASYRVAAVVVVMVVIAWALSIMYERETMLELSQITPSNEPGPAREMAEPAAVDTREVENKAPVPVLSEVVEDKVAPKKPAPEKPVAEKSVRVKVVEIPEVTKKKQPNAAVPVRWQASEKPAESPVQEASIPKATALPKKPEPTVSETIQTKTPVVSKDATPPNPSVQAATGLPVKAFPEIPIPKTYKTPFIERSQVLAFLKKYTAAYERGNAETFFSYFTGNAVENGQPLKMFKPDYLEIWNKVQSLDYRIFVNELNQFVGSDMVSMKGRFDLDWKFRNGRSGQSRGDISMDLKLNESALQVSRLDYRFD